MQEIREKFVIPELDDVTSQGAVGINLSSDVEL